MLTKNQILKLAAIFSLMSLLGACASTGGNGTPQYPLEKLGKSVTETGNRIWDGTRYLFKLKDSEDTVAEGDLADEYFDEFDTEVFDEIEISDVDATGVEKPLDLDSLGSAITTDVDSEISDEVMAVKEIPDSSEDLYHTVGENESLWVLAKMLTGNANNWRALAEINNLDESGSVYVGQRIRIPAEMKRVPLDDEVVADNQPAIEAEPQAETMQAKAAGETDSKPMMAAGDGEEFEVLAGESLWFFAKRTTGNSANWTKIAQANNMSESEANNVRFGQTILVPGDLVIDGAGGQKQAASEATMQKSSEAAVAVADAIQPREGNTSEAEVTLAAATDKPATGSAEDEIKIVEANFQSEPPKELPLAKQSDDLLAEQGEVAPGTEADGDAVMVSGTYYPKAIYNEANFSSSLLMRVSPGTKLNVSKAVGPWFEVVTDKGVGYVHSRDTK